MRVNSVLTVLVAGGLVLSLACQPEDERPGLHLSGTPATEPATDWRFTDEIEEIFIETRTRYLLRHSTTIWCAELDGELYIGSYGDEVKFWEKNASRDSRARLRIDDVIHDVTVTPVSSQELIRTLDDRYAEKYDMEEVFGDDLPAWRYYSIASSS
jgi:hypothetical protein